jgi:hypothetical protein
MKNFSEKRAQHKHHAPSKNCCSKSIHWMSETVLINVNTFYGTASHSCLKRNIRYFLFAEYFKWLFIYQDETTKLFINCQVKRKNSTFIDKKC